MSEPVVGVQLGLYIGEDWTQVLQFYSDAISDPQTFNDPMALASPFMAVKQTGFNTVVAEFNPTGSGLGAGTAVVSGGSSNILTLALPFAFTYTFEGMTELSFDIFATVAAKRIAVVKSGIIVLAGATTAADNS